MVESTTVNSNNNKSDNSSNNYKPKHFLEQETTLSSLKTHFYEFLFCQMQNIYPSTWMILA
jgi:hypothetical protein